MYLRTLLIVVVFGLLAIFAFLNWRFVELEIFIARSNKLSKAK